MIIRSEFILSSCVYYILHSSFFMMYTKMNRGFSLLSRNTSFRRECLFQNSSKNWHEGCKYKGSSAAIQSSHKYSDNLKWLIEFIFDYASKSKKAVKRIPANADDKCNCNCYSRFSNLSIGYLEDFIVFCLEHVIFRNLR